MFLSAWPLITFLSEIEIKIEEIYLYDYQIRRIKVQLIIDTIKRFDSCISFYYIYGYWKVFFSCKEIFRLTHWGKWDIEWKRKQKSENKDRANGTKDNDDERRKEELKEMEIKSTSFFRLCLSICLSISLPIYVITISWYADLLPYL